MSTATKLNYAEWLTEADTAAVLKALGAGARVVGGSADEAV